MLEELKRRVEQAVKTYEGAVEAGMVLTLSPTTVFLAKHGEALIAQYELAESADALYEADGDGAWWASQWADFEERVKALRKAKENTDAKS